jgi:thiamine-phosphate diphosphorylase
LREKEMPSSRLLALASRLRDITRNNHARLIIHTQADIAEAVGADGIHVASDQITAIPQIRDWLGDQAMSISASCHNTEELAAAAEQGADWATLSPVFPTLSHPGMPHLGIGVFHDLADHSPLPVVALGGITVQNAPSIGSAPIAVIGAILDADKPGLAARQLSLSPTTI